MQEAGDLIQKLQQASLETEMQRIPASAARAPLLAAVDFEHRRALHGLADDLGISMEDQAQVCSCPCCAWCSPQAGMPPKRRV